MTTRSRVTARLTQGNRDDGFAMVLVIGFTAVLAGLIAVGTAVGIRTLQSSRSHLNFENALAVAESGIDGTLAEINTAYNSVPSNDYVTGGGCGFTFDQATFTTEKQEREAARAKLEALPTTCTTTTVGGQYVAVRPGNRRAVYSLSWTPSRTAPGAKRRLVKAEYLFAPYKPSNAVLTDGNLDFSGSVAISPIGNITDSNVHSNGTATGFNGSTNIDGQLSSTGTLGSCPSSITGGCLGGAAVQSVPTIKARTYYTSKADAYRANWFDLCPDGTMRKPPTTATLVPCTGAALTSTNGWQFTAGSGTTAPVWTLPRTAGGPFNGVYYAFESDAVLGSNGNSKATWQISVLAEAKTTGVVNSATCNKLGGNINWKLFNLAPWLPGLQLLADANLTGSANADAGSGLFLAGDKIDLNTSSSTITGAVVAGNLCAAAGQNTIQGVSIIFDDTLEAPLSDMIRTALWLDYAAG